MAETQLGCGPLTVKYIVFLFNFLFVLSGFALIIIGAIAQAFFREYFIFFENHYATPAMALIIIGIIVFIVSFFGCCGAKRENVCMLKMFSGIMVFILVCELAAAIAVVAMKSDVEQEIQKNMKESLNQYNDTEQLVTKTWDKMQQEFKCCGVYNYTDWNNATVWHAEHPDAVPDSCCHDMKPGCGTHEDSAHIYIEGCYESLYETAKHSIAAIAGGALVLALVQVLGIWMSCCLISAVKQRYEIL